MFCYFFLGVPGISTTPRIIYPLEKSHRMAFNLALSWKCSQPFMCPSISSIFFSARSIWLWLFCPVSGLVGWLWQLRFYSKGSGHLTYHQNNFFPVETSQNGIQHGFQHGSFLEVPPKCPNLACFPLFLPSSQQEAFGCDCLFHVCSVSGLVGWLWQLLFYSKGSGHLTYP